MYIADLEQSHNDDFLEIVTWLKECKSLQILTFTRFLSASVIAPILLETNIHLISLKYEGFGMWDNTKFHHALANQTSLQSLWLNGFVDEYAVETDVLVDSLSKLVNLTHLHLEDESENFDNRHIVQLAHCLPKLEFWSTRAYLLSDDIWDDVATLRSLRRLELEALTDFTANGILHFIQKLGPGNKGFHLSAMNSEDSTSDPWWEKRALIEEEIAKKVGGTFRYVL